MTMDLLTMTDKLQTRSQRGRPKRTGQHLSQIRKYLVISTSWGSTPRQTDWLTVSYSKTFDVESGRADALRASCYCGGRKNGNAKLATVSLPQVPRVWAHVISMRSVRSQLLGMQRKQSGWADALRASCYCGGRKYGNAKLAAVSFPQVPHVWAHVRNKLRSSFPRPLSLLDFPVYSWLV
jgi:hypothetical protein